MSTNRIVLHSSASNREVNTRLANLRVNGDDYSEVSVSAFRGILIGLWLTCTSVLLLALVPGLDISIGNLPGDIEAGTQDGIVRLPFATAALVVVTLTGLYFRIASHWSRH